MNYTVWRKLAFNYSVWFLYTIINYTYNVIRGLYWRLNGVHHQLVVSRIPENYHKSAHVQRIVYRRYLDGFMTARELDFVTVHEAFTSPECVLDDDWSLFTLTKTQAFFVLKSKDWPQPLFKSDFFYLGQFASSVKVISMPLNQFNRLAEGVKDDGAKLVLLQNQARSGGTLLMSIFKETGRCVCFNEPHVMAVVTKHIYSDHVWRDTEARRLYRSTVRLLCKPYRGLHQPVLAYVVRPSVLSMLGTQLAHEVCPDAVQLFIYREPIRVAISLRRIGEVIDSLKLMYYLPNIPRSTARLVSFFGYPNNSMEGWTCAEHAELEFGYRLACFTMHHYKKALNRGLDIHGIRYLDLITHPETMIRKLLRVCQLPESLIQKGMNAMGRDSQGDSPVSWAKLQQAIPNPPEATPRFLGIARAMSAEFDVPGPEEFANPTFRLQNSLEP